MEKEFEHRLTEVEDRSKSNSRRLEGIEKRQDNLDELVGTVKVLVDREERVEGDVKEIKSDVKSLTSKPAKRWDNLISQLITLAVAAIFALIAAKLS